MILNISDPRVRRRCISALEFTTMFVNIHKPKELSTRWIDQHFGHNGNPLSKHLRSMLLIAVDHFYDYNDRTCKKYIRNVAGCEQLHNMLYPDLDQKTVENTYEQVYAKSYVKKFSDELTTGKFKYKDKSNRHWHPIQNIPSEIRKRELAKYGYRHIYDIRTAAPSIILHLARDLGVKLKHISAIEYYIENKSTVRDNLSRDLGIPVTDVKRLITMLFNGAPLGFSPTYTHATTKILRGDSRTINAVKNNEFISELRANIRYVWHRLSNHRIDGEYVMQRSYHADGRKKRISSRDRWDLYFSYERRVMDVITAYLDKQHARYLIEHDGWSSDIQIDLLELTEHVRSSTGIHTIEFDYECN